MTLTQAQYKLEEEAIGMGVANYVHAKGKAEERKDVANLSPENFLMRSALLRVAEAIENYLLETPKGHGEYQRVRKVLLRMEPEEIAYLTLQAAFNSVKDTSLQQCAKKIATAIRQHLDYTTFKREMPGYLRAVEQTLNSKNTKYKATVLSITMNRKDLPREEWGHDEPFCIHLGSFCVLRMLEAVDLFERIVVGAGKNSTAYLRRTEQTVRWLEDAHNQCAYMSPQFLPMVIPPAEWSDMYDGGFLNSEGAYRIPAVRSRYEENRVAVSRVASMDKVYDALNALQNTAYRVNKRVLEVMEEGKTNGLGKLPQPDIKLLLPQPFWSTDEEYKRLCDDEPERIKQWRIDRTQIYDAWMRDRSKRMTLHWQTWTAKKFSEFERIYFVWNMDWRGRVYPVQQYLNPQADANGKSLLEFAEGKPLGSTGAKWLAIHGANCYGEDKISLEARIQWVKDNEDAIIDSALNPLDGQLFWATADEPYMFLAFCFEWLGYVREGEAFVSHLPVAVDGSCSGLQHYSAMLRDEIGGQYVNLIPADKPADVYARVANVAETIVARDLDNPMASLWHGKIDRGIAKRNCMTFAYSATLFGFTDQLKEELRKRDADSKQDGGDGYLTEPRLNTKAAAYLAKVNMQAIGATVVKAYEAMQWIKDTARVITKANHLIEWITPSGMKVIQKYPKMNSKRVSVFQGQTRVRMAVDEPTQNEDPQKHASAAAPNLIHSLDASHLVLTVNRCLEHGIDSFAMIHDSFGTHAADMEEMSRILRETFVEMYSVDILRDFYEQLRDQLPEEVFKEIAEPPTMGELDIKQVHKSAYFFA